MSLRQRGGKSQPTFSVQNDEPPTKIEREVDPGIRPSQAAASLIDYAFVLSLVLGGCCANMWAFEYLLNMNPRIGSALSFSQTIFVTAQGLPQFLTWSSWIPRLKPRQVPIRRWALQVVVVTSGSLLNNWAFAFHVPLTIQIVFRSAGLAVSMLFGYFFLGKSYKFMQVVSVLVVSVGIILTTLSRPAGPTKWTSDDLKQYLIGVTMLGVSSSLTGILGVLQEQTYTEYGPCWREGVFYTHFLSLPVFLFLARDVKQGLLSLSSSSVTFPGPYIVLAANLLSQLTCVSAVNKLSSQVSSVSTNLVLTFRKALSLCFSVWWSENGWNLELGLGAILVFAGSLLFTLQ